VLKEKDQEYKSSQTVSNERSNGKIKTHFCYLNSYRKDELIASSLGTAAAIDTV
jgi:hypothetical protein